MKNIKSIKDLWNKFRFILTKPQKKWGVVVVIMTLFGALFETLGVSIILPLVQVMIEPSALRNNEFLEPFFDRFGLDTNAKLIWTIGMAVMIIYVIKNIYMFLLSYVRIKYACKIQRELSVEMMSSYMQRGYSFFLNTGTGELLRGVTGSIGNTYQALYQSFKIIAEILTVTCICVFIMMTDLRMAVIVIVLAIGCLIAVIFGFRNWTRRCGEINYKYAAVINKILLQAFQGIKEVLVMRRQKYFVNSYERTYIKQQKGIIGQTVSIESPAFLIEGACVIGLITAVCFQATNTESAAMLVPQLASFAVGAFRILPSLGKISSSFNQFMFSVPGINDTYNNLKSVRMQRQENPILTDYSLELSGCESLKDKAFQDKIALQDLFWHYPNVENNVLKGINIEIKKGDAIAFVGPSGSGKTTLADVILGLLYPQSGKILMDGVDIQDIPEQWSKTIGFVPQNVYLVDDTIRRNIAFGIEDDDIQDELIWKALEQAQLKEVVEELTDGIDTWVGERGIRFSGGQRQRIAIARALYEDPDILVLDEATSALDSETESAVMESIKVLQGHKTLIVIAHRLTTIKNCDAIYRVENGRAIECKYEEL